VLIFGSLTLVSTILAAMILYRIVTPRGEYGNCRRLVLAAMLLSISIVTVACVATGEPRCHYFLNGFRAWVLETADLAKIREWSRSLEPTDRPIPEAKWPQAVSTLKPVSVSLYGPDAAEVQLNWGGGFMHWGLVVRRDKGESDDRSRFEYTIDVAPESYIWID
jgi:hypothetical protein